MIAYLPIAAIVAISLIVYIKNIRKNLFGINWTSTQFLNEYRESTRNADQTVANRAGIIGLSVLIGLTWIVSGPITLVYLIVNFIIKPKPNNNAKDEGRNPNRHNGGF